MDMLLKEAGIPETIEDSDLCGPSQVSSVPPIVYCIPFSLILCTKDASPPGSGAQGAGDLQHMLP